MSLRELRKKIKTIRQIKQITQAMKMVAAAKLHHAHSNIFNARPFALKMKQLANFLAGEKYEDIPENILPYLSSKTSANYALLVVSSDKGFCGAFNNNIFHKTESCFLEKGDPSMIFTVGRKISDYLGARRIKPALSYNNIIHHISYSHADLLSRAVINNFEKGKFDSLYVIYGEFKSLLTQKPVLMKLLPLSFDETEEEKSKPLLFEPQKNEILKTLIPRYISSQIYKIFIESYASELASRVNAMEQASKNANELINTLTLKMNKMRQTMITTQILDIISGDVSK